MVIELSGDRLSESPLSNDWELASIPSTSGLLERSIDLSHTSSSSRDPKDVYNLIPGEELSRSKENRRPSDGITPPPPSPMHVGSTSTPSSGYRVPLKEKSSSVEGKVQTSDKASDGSRSASPEPSETALLHPNLCHARSTPIPLLPTGTVTPPIASVRTFNF